MESVQRACVKAERALHKRRAAITEELVRLRALPAASSSDADGVRVMARCALKAKARFTQLSARHAAAVARQRSSTSFYDQAWCSALAEAETARLAALAKMQANAERVQLDLAEEEALSARQEQQKAVLVLTARRAVESAAAHRELMAGLRGASRAADEGGARVMQALQEMDELVGSLCACVGLSPAAVESAPGGGGGGAGSGGGSSGGGGETPDAGSGAVPPGALSGSPTSADLEVVVEALRVSVRLSSDRRSAERPLLPETKVAARPALRRTQVLGSGMAMQACDLPSARDSAGNESPGRAPGDAPEPGTSPHRLLSRGISSRLASLKQRPTPTVLRRLLTSPVSLASPRRRKEPGTRHESEA
jgi:hypothetical protein